MIKVLRQLPRKSRIIIAVRQAAMTASRTTPWIEALTKIDWSVSKLRFRPSAPAGRVCWTSGISF